MFSPRAKRNIRRILPFGIIWFVLGIVFLLVEYAAIDQNGAGSSSAIKLNLSIFIFATLAVFVVGFLVGTFEVLFLERKFKHMSFGRQLLLKVLIYAVIFFLIILVNFPLAASMEMKVGIFDERVWDRYFEFLGSVTYASTMFQLTISLVCSLFYLEVYDHVGHELITNFISGYYGKPRDENRVFMFVDMRSSTTIAEKLGHHKYFKLIKDYYSDLSEPVISYGGNVYQYVGDEMVVTWPPKQGLERANCVACFQAMQAKMKDRSNYYEKQYGVVPEFKAGIHFGSVTTGQIGVEKKEMLHTGDVLNVTARIQALCNTYDKSLLVSDDLKKALMHKIEIEFSNIGEVTLRGRVESMKVWSVE